MLPSPFVVVLDANVLFPFTLRDTLLSAAHAGLYQVRWTAEILDEATRNLVAKRIMTEDKATRLRSKMEEVFPEAAVAGYESLIPAMENDPKDRHVVAAAVKAGAQVIVTLNMKDFVPLPEEMEAQSPDEFLCNLFDLDPRRLMEVLRDQVEPLKKPPMTVDDLLDRLAKFAPDFVEEVREHLGEGVRRSRRSSTLT